MIKDFLKHFHIEQREPGLELLAQVVRALSTLPYENVTKIIKSRLQTDFQLKKRFPPEVWADHLQYGAGGTCFSLTEFNRRLLESAGFECYPAMADMRHGENIHCALIVKLAGQQYLVDTGYLLTTPLLIPESGTSTVDTPFNRIVIAREGSLLRLYTMNNGQLKWRYTMRLEPVDDETFMQHWDNSFDQTMLNNILLTRVTEKGQVYFHRKQLRTVSKSEKIVQRVKDDFGLLNSVFQIDRHLIIQANEILANR